MSTTTRNTAALSATDRLNELSDEISLIASLVGQDPGFSALAPMVFRWADTVSEVADFIPARLYPETPAKEDEPQ